MNKRAMKFAGSVLTWGMVAVFAVVALCYAKKAITDKYPVLGTKIQEVQNLLADTKNSHE